MPNALLSQNAVPLPPLRDVIYERPLNALHLGGPCVRGEPIIVHGLLAWLCITNFKLKL